MVRQSISNFFSYLHFFLDYNSLDQLPSQADTELEENFFNCEELLQNRTTAPPAFFQIQNYGASNFDITALQTVPDNAFTALFGPDFLANPSTSQQPMVSTAQRPVTPPDILLPTIYVAPNPQPIPQLMTYSAQHQITASNSSDASFSGISFCGGSSSGDTSCKGISSDDTKLISPSQGLMDPYASIKKATLNINARLLQSFPYKYCTDRLVDGRFCLKFASHQVNPGDSFNGFRNDNTPTLWLRNDYNSLDGSIPVHPITPRVNNTERRILYVGFEFYNGTGHKSKKNKKGDKIDPRDIGEVAVSCIYWPQKKDWFITSTDFIELIEVCLLMHFCREERNRIRRNLQCFEPITLTKNAEKKDADPVFFARVMGYDEPTTSKIEKDIKVFRWSTLVAGMNKVINSFVASSTTCSRPPNKK